MDDAVRARNAAVEALADIEPERLHDALHSRLTEAAMTPAVLTLRVAEAFDPDAADSEGVAERAVGVQLIYEGLRLTRTLAHEEPWASELLDGTPRKETDLDGIQADLDILAADVFVSRGFYLLARTEAAGRAVEVVRAFGRDQTDRRGPDADVESLDGNLESDVFALAAVAGATAVGTEPTDALETYATDLADGGATARRAGSLPTDLSERVLAHADDERLPSSAADS